MHSISEFVSGRVSQGLVLAWFELYVLCLVFLDSSLQSTGREKNFSVLFIPLLVVHEIQLSDLKNSFSCLL